MKKSFLKIASIALCIAFLIQTYIPAAASGLPKTDDRVQIIVKYNDIDSKDSIKTKLKQKNISQPKLKKSFQEGLLDIVEIGSKEKVNDYLSFYNENLDNIEYATLDYTLTAYADSETKSMDAGEEALSTIDLTSISSSTGNGVLVGVLDTGIDVHLSSIKNNVYVNKSEKYNFIDDDKNGYADDVRGWDFVNKNNSVYDSHDDESHGTAIAESIARVAPGAKIVPLKFMINGKGNTADAIEAIEYAKAVGVKIINCSFGTSEYNYALKDAIQNSGITFVCAAGNEGSNSVVYPAAFSLPNVISVGGLNPDGSLYANTSSNNGNDLYAPAVRNISDVEGGSYTGTSFSAAYVSGVYALAAATSPKSDCYSLSEAVKESYTLHDDLKVINAAKAVSTAQSLGYLESIDPKFASIIKTTGKTLDSTMAELLHESTKYTDIPQKAREDISSFFSLNTEDMEYLCSEGLGIIDSVITLKSSEKANLSVEQAQKLKKHFKDSQIYEDQIDQFGDVVEFFNLPNEKASCIYDALLSGFSIKDCEKVLPFSIISGKAIKECIKKDNSTSYFNDKTYTGNEKLEFIKLVKESNVSPDIIIDYLSESQVKPSDLNESIKEWELDNNFYGRNSMAQASSNVDVDNTSYNKYKMPGASDNMNDIQVSQLEGMITYTKNFLNLAGKDGLNLELTLRYDQDDSYQSGNVKDMDDLPVAYQVKYTVDVYYVKDGVETLEFTDHPEYSPIYTDAALHNHYVNQSTIVEEISDTFYIVDVVKDAKIIIAHTEKDPISTSLVQGSYNDFRYDLGYGWAWSFPSMEIKAGKKIVHFADGQKFNIKSSGSYYTLEGYPFEDIKLYSVSSTEFTCGGKSSAWALVYKNGKRDYFDSSGRYIGTVNKLNSDISIQVYYNSSNRISHIIDSVGRKIEFIEKDFNEPYENPFGEIEYQHWQEVYVNLYDVNSSTGKKILQLEKYPDYNTEQDYQLCRVKLYNDDGSLARNLRYSYTAQDDNATIYYNCMGFLHDPDGTTGDSITIHQKNSVLSYIYDENLGVAAEDSGIIYINYENHFRLLSEATFRKFSRVASIQRAQINGEFLDEKIYSYWLVDTKTNTRSPLRYNNAWDQIQFQYWPRNENVRYELDVNTTGRTITYKYNESRKNDEIVVHDLDQAVYSTTNITYNDNDLPVQEITRRNGNGVQLCTIKNTAWDSYGNIVSNKVETGYSVNGGTPVVTDVLESLTVTYGENKLIPTKKQIGIYKKNSAEDYVLVEENYFNQANDRVLTNIVYSQNLADPSRKNYLRKTDSLTESYKLTDTIEYDLLIDDGGVKHTKYSYDSKYNIYIAKIEDLNSTIGKNGQKSTTEVTYEYDILGRTVASSNGGAPRRNSFEYDALGNTIKTTFADSTSTTTGIDYCESEVVQTAADGSKIKYIYDSLGNLEYEYRFNTQTAQYELLKKYLYDLEHRVSRVYEYLDQAGTQYNYAQYEYDYLDRLLSIKVYDQNRNKLSEQVFEREITMFEGTACEKTIIHTEYNNNQYSRVIEYLDASGNLFAVETEYQPNQFYSDRYSYSAYGKLESCSGDTIDTSVLTYDKFGRSVEVKNALNQSTYSTYDGFDQLIQTTDYNGNQTDYDYDPLGRVYHARTIFEKDGDTKYYSENWSYYDLYGNIVETAVTNNEPDKPSSTSTMKYEYDVMNRLIKTQRVIDSNNSLYTQYCYDSLGSIVKTFTGLSSPLTIIDKDHYTPNGDTSFSVTETVYDQYHNVSTYKDGLNREEQYTYDFADRLLTSTSRNGVKTTYIYDNLGRQTSVSAGSITHTIAYNTAGQIASATDENGSFTYTYDLMGRLLTETRDDNDNSRDYILTYTYTPRNVDTISLKVYNTATQSYEEKQYQDYEYDSLSRLSSLTYKASQSETASVSVSYAYNNNSQLAETVISQNGNSIKTNYTYNNAGLIKAIQQQSKSDTGTYTDVWNESYSYKLDGNLYKKIDSANQKTEYGYDSIGRLTTEHYSEGNSAIWSASYSFDDFDNRTTKVYNDLVSSTQTTTQYAYDLANRLTGETVSGSDGYAYTYNYDDSGNLLSKVKNQNNTETVEIQNTYDAFNRMVQSVTSSSGNVTYRYDGSGRRISKTSAGTVTNHFWDGDNIIADLTADKPAQNYIYGASGVEAIALSGTGGQHTVSAYLKNAHGDVVGVRSLGNTGNSEYKYDSYGNELLDTSGIENPFRYSGQYFDSETGYYYLRARYYDPQSGRFTQEDTYHGEPSDPATLNLYGYCAANPVRYQDSSGHWLETVFDVVSLGFSVYDMFKEPSWTNFGFLVWDVASLLPFVPGSYAGKAVKAISKIDDVTDTLKIVKRTVDAVDTVMDTGKAIKKSVSTADKISDVAKTAKKSIKAALSTSSKDIVAEAAAKQKKLIKRTQDTVSQLKSKASQAVKKIDVSVGKADGVGKTPGFDKWLGKGASDHKVYFGMKGDDAVYTGITKQSKEARLYQHNNPGKGKIGKGLDDLRVKYDGLTRNQARAIEQYYIENGPNALNKINSISPRHRFYQDARDWAIDFLSHN